MLEARAGLGGSSGRQQKPPSRQICARPSSPFSLTWQCPGEGRASPARGMGTNMEWGQAPGPRAGHLLVTPALPPNTRYSLTEPMLPHAPPPWPSVRTKAPSVPPGDSRVLSVWGWGGSGCRHNHSPALLVGSPTPTIVSALFPVAWATPSG